MNILIPHKWLLDHLDTKATPDTIRQNVSLCGPSIERIERVLNDSVYDIEVTTNRIDAMSVRGIAREIATILPEFDIKAHLKPLKLDATLKKITSQSLPDLDLTIINDEKLSHRIVAIKLENVSLGDSPAWLAQRLEQVGQRSINNIVDITNYVMWELGHPVHAFDYDKLTQKTIIMREAKKGEKITTLDHKTHTTKGGEVIFDDGTGEIIDLPGIMGTNNTVVSSQTKNVLLWIESIDAVKIRKASMGLSIRSQAAILNEKGVDPNLALDAINRAVELYIELCNAQIGSKLVDIYPHPQTPQSITLKHSKVTEYLGVEIESQRIVRILENLGCNVKVDTNTFQVIPPSYRANDITIYQDLIEEVARMYGYHNLPSVIMPTTIPDTPSDENFDLEHFIKTLLSGWGLNEVYTYSMISKETALLSGTALKDHLEIKNPLTDDMVYLRTSLIPSLLKITNENPNKAVFVFEMQNVFHKATNPYDLPTEDLRLTILTNYSYARLKGILDALAQKLFIDITVIPSENSARDGFDARWGTVSCDGESLGTIGITIKQNVFALDLSMSTLQGVAHTHPTYIPIVNTPPIIEDLTFAIKTQTHISPVMEAMQEVSPLIESVHLKDSYENKSTQTTNFTFTLTYRDKVRQLTDGELVPIRKAIVKKLQEKAQATLVGSL